MSSALPLSPAALAGRRVAVAMSGGVDSSVAAALLRDAGAEVVGLSLRLYDLEGEPAPEASALRAPALPEASALRAPALRSARTCCAPDDLYDARAVAQALGIAHYVLDATTSFARDVVGDFVSSYLGGQTPNPCVRCNEKTKFRDLAARAEALGCAALVTGHYARVVAHGGGLALARARDARRDQSYFLFMLGPTELASACFPLGELHKDEVRALARERGLPVADKPDSMEVCFVGGGKAADFVARHAEALPGEGEVIDLSGRLLGRHGGIHRYTVGQRHGLGLGGGRPWYVVGIDAPTNRVVVGGAEDALADGCRVVDVRWASESVPAAMRASVQVRSRTPPAAALVRAEEREAFVRFDAPVRAVAPGQAAVFYDGERVLGGGWIAEAIRES